MNLNTMIKRQIEGRGVKDPCVLKALRKIDRKEFVPEHLRSLSYADEPLPIGEGQTISQPYIVGLMTELLQIKPSSRVLEIGTGSGYQTAILAEIAAQVYTVEIIASLSSKAALCLKNLGFQNIVFRCSDGSLGWPEFAPFDRILITCAPPKTPQCLFEQLKTGGRLVVPEGRFFQDLVVYEKQEKIIQLDVSVPVRFVPMTGKAELTSIDEQ